MNKIVLKIGGMTCSACSSGLEKYLSRQKGIRSANVNLVLSIATIEYENLKKRELERFISEAGFQSLGEFKNISAPESNKEEKQKLFFFGMSLILMMYLSMSSMLHLPELPLFNPNHASIFSSTFFLATLPFLWYGYDILKSGMKNLLHKMPNMDTLVTCSITFSFLYSLYGYLSILKGNIEYIDHLYFVSICMVIYFIKLGRFIENIGKDQTTNAIKDLVCITPQKATIKVGKEEKQLSLDEVKKGDILLCKSGEKIAVDGVVTLGQAHVDESFITGESKPVLKEKGKKVIAGSINYDGYLEYQAENIGAHSTISEIVKLVIESTNSKSKVQRMADKISSYFVPFVLLIAILTFVFQLQIGLSFEKSLIHMITILVVACPCSIGLAVPLVVIVSNGLCAKKGLFFKKSEVLETAKNIDTIVLDKTGTLTYGKLNIFKVYNYSDYEEKELLNIVANLENNSTHPIASAFLLQKKLKVENFKVLNGIGLTANIEKKEYYLGNDQILKDLNLKNNVQKEYESLVKNGCSIIYVIENRKIIGLIGVRDTIRKESREFIKEVEKRKMEGIMLTGDNQQTAITIAKELGINKVIAGVLPTTKIDEVKRLVKEGRKVIMVGDGINDAPALLNATIGISINEGTEVANLSSDVIVMNNNLNNILDLITISHQSSKIIKQNLFWAFIYNICMIPIAMGLFENVGLSMNPMLGSIAMTLSSLTVVLNAYLFGRRAK